MQEYTCPPKHYASQIKRENREKTAKKEKNWGYLSWSFFYHHNSVLYNINFAPFYDPGFGRHLEKMVIEIVFF